MRGRWGGREVLRAVPWGAWAGPLLHWTGFILLCYAIMVCVVSLLSRQPLYNERMNFPLLRVPIMLQEAFDENRIGRFFLDRWLVAGLLVPVCLHLLNGLSFYNPSIPSIPTLILAGKFFPKAGLFSGFFKLKICIYPAFIGFAFLTARQISFSLWVFFLAGCLLIGLLNVLGVNIPAAALGTTFSATLSRPEETQSIGAYIVFFVFLAWLARFHFKDTLLKAIGRRREEDPASRVDHQPPGLLGPGRRLRGAGGLVPPLRAPGRGRARGAVGLLHVHPGRRAGHLPGRDHLLHAHDGPARRGHRLLRVAVPDPDRPGGRGGGLRRCSSSTCGSR